MDNYRISELADKVTIEKDRLRKALLSRLCHEKEISEHRTVVFERELTLSKENKQTIMREAFNLVLHDYPFDDRGLLKRLIGTELNHRKRSRKDQSREILHHAIAEHEQRFGSVSEDELMKMKAYLRQEATDQLKIQELIESGKASREENGNLIFFNAKEDE